MHKPRQRLGYRRQFTLSVWVWILHLPPSTLAWRDQCLAEHLCWAESCGDKTGDYIPGKDSSLKLIFTKVVSALVNITSQHPFSGPEGQRCGVAHADTTEIWPLPCSLQLTAPS